VTAEIRNDVIVATEHIMAPPEVVFPYFTDPALIVTWIGDRAELDPQPGGVFLLGMGQVTARGAYINVNPPYRVSFSWGVPGSDTLPPGGSTVEVVLTPVGDGTMVVLTHRGLLAADIGTHRAGWEHQLGLLRVAAGLAGAPSSAPWKAASTSCWSWSLSLAAPVRRSRTDRVHLVGDQRLNGRCEHAVRPHDLERETHQRHRDQCRRVGERQRRRRQRDQGGSRVAATSGRRGLTRSATRPPAIAPTPHAAEMKPVPPANRERQRASAVAGSATYPPL